MDRSVPDRRDSPQFRARLAEVYAGLRRAAAGGVVPPHAFKKAVAALGLDEAEQARLADGLARLKLYVGEDPVHSGKTDSRHRGAAASSRVETVRRLLERFADAEGRVAGRAVEGAARLAGLSEQETEELRRRAPALSSSPRRIEKVSADREQPGTAAQKRNRSPAKGENLSDAVSAAMAVLAEDRSTPNPQNRILTAEQEVGLAILLRGGPKRMGIEPSKEELAALAPADIRRQARDCLVLHNQRLVHSVVRQYQEEGLEYEDVFQHGMLGLMRAARKFDPCKGNKFSTYATWWIRQSITRAIANESNIIRIPLHIHQLAHKVARVERELLAHGHSLRAAEVAVAADLSVTQVEEIRRISRRTDSLDRAIRDDTSLAELLEVRTAIPGFEQKVLDTLSEKEMHEVVHLLPDRLAHILIRRFGLDGRDPATLDVIGNEMGITRERVRQLEARVLQLLRVAYRDPAGTPFTTLRLMLTDPWHQSRSYNPVSAILADLKNKEWTTAIDALCEFRKRNPDSLPGPDHEEGTFPLGRWLHQQRRAGGINGRGLPTHRRIVLESLGVEWEQSPRRRHRLRLTPRTAPKHRYSATARN